MPAEPRILITGAGGILGQRFTPLCNTNTFATYHHQPQNNTSLSENTAVGDLTDERFIGDLIKRVQPDVIVNLAALTNVERCETDAALAQRVNVGIVEKLLTLAPKARFVQISTDYVFDGAKGNYTPSDTPAPISLYGQTKRDAEIMVLQNSNNLVVRTSGTYDWLERHNLFTFFYNRLSTGKETLALAGCHYSPIWADDLAKGLLSLIKTEATGIIHYAGAERQTRYDFAKTIAKAFNFDESLIRPVMQEKFNWRARRPEDSSLDSSLGFAHAQYKPQSSSRTCSQYRKNMKR